MKAEPRKHKKIKAHNSEVGQIIVQNRFGRLQNLAKHKKRVSIWKILSFTNLDLELGGC